MTVQELIDELSAVTDKSLPVFVWDNGDRIAIDLIDTDLSDCIDINIER